MKRDNSHQQSFGEYLKSLRKQRGLTLIQLQEKSKVSNSYLSQVENNQFTPSNEVLAKLSKPLGVPLIKLMYKAGHIPDEIYQEHWDIEGQLMEDELTIKDSIKRIRQLLSQKTERENQLKQSLNNKTQEKINQQLIDISNSLNKEFRSILEIIEERSKRDKELDKVLNLMKEFIESKSDKTELLDDYFLDEKIAIEDFSNSLKRSAIKSKLSRLINPLDLIYEEEFKNYINTYYENLKIDQWRKDVYPDIREILNEPRTIFYDKKPLSQKHKKQIKGILDIILKDVKKDYPSYEEIESVYKKMKRSKE